MSWKRILFAVATPGSMAAGAMSKAVSLAAALNAELELFHCAFHSDIAFRGRFTRRALEPDIRDHMDQQQWQIEQAAARLSNRKIKISASVCWDYPAYEGIIRQVLRREPDLLIVQSTHHGLATRVTRTDFKLIETCPCPLLLIKSERPYTHARTIAAVDPLHTHDKSVTLDDQILKSAAMLTRALSGELLVLHARTPWEDVVRATPALQGIPEVEQPDVQAAYSESVSARVWELSRRHDVPEARTWVIDGHAAEVLPRFARTESADIVAMGAVSRPLLKRILIGHTAERVLDRLSCDVLIAKPLEFQTPVKSESTHRIERSHHTASGSQ